jgi:hypothetical protein
LIRELNSGYAKLNAELDRAGSAVGALTGIGQWTIKDLLSVRAWWTEQVVAWIESGRAGEKPVLPARGFKWTETPRLNDSIVEASRADSYATVRARLNAAFHRATVVIDSLTDRELLEPGVFAWAGKWPLARWISINTTRQYATALTFIRRAVAGSAPRRPDEDRR